MCLKKKYMKIEIKIAGAGPAGLSAAINLAKAGYKVKVTKKSGDQGADLIVEKEGVSTAIQTKKYAGNVGNTAVQEVVASMKYYDCDKAMVITTGKFTKGAFELASRNGIQLIDKKGLNELFDSIL